MTTPTENHLDQALYFELLTRLTSSQDCAALACTCTRFAQFSVQCKKEYRELAKNNAHFGLFFANYCLAKHQVEALNYLWTQKTTQPYTYCKMPMSSGKTAIALVYCAEYARVHACSALIAVPTKALEVFANEAQKLTIGERVFIVKEGQTQLDFNQQGVVYVIDRSRRSKQLNLGLGKVECVFVDEAHTGESSLKNICSAVYLANEKQPTVQLVLMTASTKNNPNEVGKNLEISVLFRKEADSNHRYGNLRFEIYEPLLADFNKQLPNVYFYPCLLVPGSYYSAQAQPETLAKIEEEKVALLYDALNLYKEKFLVVCANKAVMNQVYESLQKLAQSVAKCYFLSDLLSTTARVAVVELNKFSESLNITTYRNLFLYDYEGTEQRARQCIGRLQRTTNNTSFLRVWILTKFSSLAFSVVPPQDMVDSYCFALSKREENKSNPSLSSTRALYFQPEMTLGEMTVLARKTACTNASRSWLQQQELHHYDAEDILAIVRQKPCTKTEARPGCFITEMEPILVKYRNEELKEEIKEEEADKEASVQEPEIEHLQEIVRNPRKRGLYKVEELRSFSKFYGISTAGKKEQLAERLLDILLKPDCG